MTDELVSRAIAVIAKTQHIPPESITIDSTFEDLKIDSIDAINLLFALESEFDIDIPDDAARQIRSIRQMVEGIGKLLDAKSTQASQPKPEAPPAKSSQAPQEN